MTNSSRLLQSYSTTPLYNTKMVVGETGVPADTFRAWERRYGVPRPQRGEGGQRLYSERDIATIRWLRDRTHEGLTISQAVALLESQASIPTAPDQPRSFDMISEDLRRALLHFDAPTADQVLSEAFALYGLDTVCMRIIEPTLVEIGEMWHIGTASVAQEHFASQFLRRKLLALMNIYDIPEGRATVLAAGAPGEQHDLGLLLLSLLLIRRNYRVVFLGADVPVDALEQAVKQVHPEIVCISAASSHTAQHGMHVAARLVSQYPAVLTCLGGQGLATIQPQVPGIHILTGTGVDVINQIGTLLAMKRTVE